MAGTSISPPNYHVGQPFPQETELLRNFSTDPAAPGLLVGMRARESMAQSDYDAQMAAVNAIQQQQAQATQETARAAQVGHLFSNIDKPGALKLAASMPAFAPYFQGADVGGAQSDVDRLTNMKYQGEYLRGAGAAADANINVQPGLNQYAPGMTQGPNTRITAAQIGADGHVRAAVAGKGDTTKVRIPGQLPAGMGPWAQSQAYTELTGAPARAYLAQHGGTGPATPGYGVPPAEQDEGVNTTPQPAPSPSGGTARSTSVATTKVAEGNRNQQSALTREQALAKLHTLAAQAPNNPMAKAASAAGPNDIVQHEGKWYAHVGQNQWLPLP